MAAPGKATLDVPLDDLRAYLETNAAAVPYSEIAGSLRRLAADLKPPGPAIQRPDELDNRCPKFGIGGELVDGLGQTVHLTGLDEPGMWRNSAWNPTAVRNNCRSNHCWFWPTRSRRAMPRLFQE